jgi:hypothetical protein
MHYVIHFSGFLVNSLCDTSPFSKRNYGLVCGLCLLLFFRSLFCSGFFPAVGTIFPLVGVVSRTVQHPSIAAMLFVNFIILMFDSFTLDLHTVQ